MHPHPKCKDHRDMKDKVVIVTGGTAGLGTECVYDLYQKGAIVIFTGRNSKSTKEKLIPELEYRMAQGIENKPEFLKERLKSLKNGTWDSENQNFSSEALYFRKLDQSSLGACKAFCDWFKASFTSLDTLHNNAGLALETYKETQDGFEFMMGINHYSHYLITHELLDLIKSTPRSRVVNTASIVSLKMGGMDPTIDLDDLEWERSHQKFDGMHRYGTSKLANVLFTQALATFFEDNSINAKAVCLHPGAIDSSLGRNAKGCSTKALICLMRPFMGTNKDGCQTNLACIYRDYDRLENGKYYDRLVVAKRNELADDEGYWKRFWDLSRAEIKEKAGFDLKGFAKFSYSSQQNEPLLA